MTKRRRGHGEGSIYKRKDGLWVGSLSLGHEQGRRRRKTVYGRTRREVQEKLTRLRYQRHRGQPVTNDRHRLSDFLREWLDAVVRPSTRPRTLESYRNAVETHIIPALGHIRLNELSPAHIQQLLAEQTEKGLSPRTAEYTWQVLRRALRVAVEWGLVIRNVAESVKPPRPQRSEVTPLDLSEIRKLLKTAEEHRLSAAFNLALTTGVRRGEILGLRWEDLDLEGGRLRVTGALQRVEGRLKRTAPKSDRSRRSIALPTSAATTLRRWKAIQAQERLAAGSEWADTGFVFTTDLGQPIDPRNFLRQWHRLLDDTELPRRPLHNARHSAASLMLSEGVPLKVVQEVLGHSTIRLTADLYGHLMPGDEERAAAAIDQALA